MNAATRAICFGTRVAVCAILLIGAVPAVGARAAAPADEAEREPIRKPWDMNEVGCTLLCHFTQGRDFAGSAHHLWGHICTDCHGGVIDAFDEKEAHARAAGFIGRPARESTPELCGACHPAELSDFMTGIHAATISAGGAVCIDCHDNHRVLPVADPESPVHRTRLAATCGECHPGPREQFALSAHAVASESATESPNATATESPNATGTMKSCYDCHGNHGIPAADRVLLEESCGRCHEAGTVGASAGEAIRGLMEAVDGRIAATRAHLRSVARFGLPTEPWERFLEEARAAQSMAGIAQHTVQPASVAAALQGAEAALTAAETATAEFAARRQNHITALVFTWVLIALALGLIQARRSEIRNMAVHEGGQRGGAEP